MTDRLPDLRGRDPEVRKERVKLVANGLNAVGLAFLIGSLVAPLVDPTRRFEPVRMMVGMFVGVGLSFLASVVLRYMKRREDSP